MEVKEVKEVIARFARWEVKDNSTWILPFNLSLLKGIVL